MAQAGETQRQFAQRVGLAPSRINKLVKDGMPILENGRVDTEAAILWMENNLDPERRQRAKHGSSGAVVGQSLARDKTAASSSGPIPSTGVPMAELRRQHEIVKVARARLRLETEKGRLVNRDEVKVAIFNRARRERNAHLAWAMRIAPQMASELSVDPALMFTSLDRHMRKHLDELSKTSLFDLPE